MEKYTLITGATGGLGKAFCVECASLGRNLFLTDTDDEKLSALSLSIKSIYGVKVISYASNLTDESDRKKLFDAISLRNIELSMTINVAGLDYEGGIETITSRMISTVVRLNTEAIFDITRFAATQKHDSRFYIINVASMAGFYPMPLKAMYSATKRANMQFSSAIREEIRSLNGHILVLCPSGLRTMPKVIASIESQGLMGRLTTLDTGLVAHKTIKRALRGDSKYVPGVINAVIVNISKLIPEAVKTRLIYKRWSATRAKVKGV